MIRAFFVEFLFPLLLFLILRSLVSNFLSRSRRSGAAPKTRQAPRAQTLGELKRDPVCGTYVSTAASLSRTINGEVFYFCSQECKERYLVG